MTEPTPEPTEPEESLIQVEPSDIKVGWLIEHRRVGRTAATIRGSVISRDAGSIRLSDGLELRTDNTIYGGTWWRVDIRQEVPIDPGLYWVLSPQGEPAVVMRVRSGDIIAIRNPNGIYGASQPLAKRVVDALSYVGPALVPYESLVSNPDIA